MTAEEREQLLAAERADGEKWEEFLLSVYTSDREANDLASTHSVWRLALVVFLTGLVAALGCIVAVAIAFQRFEHESVWQRGDAFLARVARQHPDMLEQQQRQPRHWNGWNIWNMGKSSMRRFSI